MVVSSKSHPLPPSPKSSSLPRLHNLPPPALLVPPFPRPPRSRPWPLREPRADGLHGSHAARVIRQLGRRVQGCLLARAGLNSRPSCSGNLASAAAPPDLRFPLVWAGAASNAIAVWCRARCRPSASTTCTMASLPAMKTAGAWMGTRRREVVRRREVGTEPALANRGMEGTRYIVRTIGT